MDIKFHLNIFLRTRNQKEDDIVCEFFVFWNYNEKENQQWNGLLCYLFYYTEWWKSQYKRRQNKSRYGDTDSSATVNSLKVSFTR